jgi:NADH-quinone oxidoreductase subunit M
MLLLWLIVPLLLGGVAAWAVGGKTWPRWISLFTLGMHLAALAVVWLDVARSLGAANRPLWLYELDLPWIPGLGIRFHLALDGLSLLLIILVNILGFVAVLASWEGIQDRVGFFHFNLLLILAAITGVFLAVDLFLFYLFWELMLVPLYLLIGIWGHERRVYATLKFFVFTQAGGLLMLLAILGLHAAHAHETGVSTFDYAQLLHTSLSPGFAVLLMLGFFAAFAVKLPVVGLHTWLPDAHTEAPTAGSVDLAGLVLKVGAYGFIRFMIPLFPAASFAFAPYAMALGVAGIVYGAWVALGQTDLKRLVAYTSISHMGFVLLGIFAWNQLALQGAVFVMLAHGISTGALFVLVGDLQDRMHTRSLDRMGGLWDVIPRFGGFGMVLAAATLGLPSLANFVGEILVLFGTYRAHPALAVIATVGFVVSTVYALWIIQSVFHGKPKVSWKLRDANGREYGIMAGMALLLMWMGMFPQTILTTARDALLTMQRFATAETQPLEAGRSAPGPACGTRQGLSSVAAASSCTGAGYTPSASTNRNSATSTRPAVTGSREGPGSAGASSGTAPNITTMTLK